MKQRFNAILFPALAISCQVLCNTSLAADGGATESTDLAGQAHFKKVLIVTLENEDYEQAIQQTFLRDLAQKGALFTNFIAEAHPSQGNYIAMTSGSLNGVRDDRNIDLNVKHIGDLLEAKGKTWKVYAEAYPGGCFTGARSGTYVRKHNPFISYLNVQKDPSRCANIVNANALQADLQADKLPDYSFYVPDLNNDGHDTNIGFADRWLSKVFGPLLQNQRFMRDMLFIVTMDESEQKNPTNHIYTAFYGNGIIPGSTVKTRHDHYSMLRTIEDAFDIGNLGQNDARATPAQGIWR